MAIRSLMVLAMAASLGCRSQTEVPPPQRTGNSAALTAPPASLEMRIGWVAGSCLAIANTTLAADSPITVVSLDEKSSVVAARIAGGTTSSETCPALLEDRRKQNESKWSFYELTLPSAIALGIGVTGVTKLLQGGIDLTDDGMPETFTQCSTSEGVSFRVWSGTPYQGLPLWSGYYYLGYDAESNCPS